MEIKEEIPEEDFERKTLGNLKISGMSLMSDGTPTEVSRATVKPLTIRSWRKFSARSVLSFIGQS